MPSTFDDNLTLAATSGYSVDVACTMVPSITFQTHVFLCSETDFPFDWANDPNREITRQMRIASF